MNTDALENFTLIDIWQREDCINFIKLTYGTHELHESWYSGIKTLQSSSFYRTFIDSSASKHVSFVGEAWSSRAQSFKWACARLRAQFTISTPGQTHRTAAHVHTKTSWHWLQTHVFIVGEETELRTNIWGTIDKERTFPSNTLHHLVLKWYRTTSATDAFQHSAQHHSFLTLTCLKLLLQQCWCQNRVIGVEVTTP